MSLQLSADDRLRILDEARRAVADTLAGRQAAPPPCEGVFALRAGLFVTFHNHGRLRGCIGYIEADRPLAELVGRFAVHAATGDPRFPSITADELDDCDIEVSILGPVQPVDDPATVVVGRDGLIVEQGRQRGLLLPQVAVEHRWDRETFLAYTCVKAGLPRDAWKRGARLSRFEADVFGEVALGLRSS